MTSLADACAAYVCDVNKALPLLSVCHAVSASGKILRLPANVLGAHWSRPEGMDTLHVLSNEYRIVPQPLGLFLQHCVKNDICIMDYLHPCSLFDHPDVASWVYQYLASRGPQIKVLEVLSYLSSSASSFLYYRHLSDLVVTGLNNASSYHAANMLCRLAYRTLDDKQLETLNMRAIGQHITHARSTAATLHLLGRLSTAQRAAVADPLAWAALRGNARAVFFLQELSRDDAHARTVSSAVARYGHSPYIDRLGLAVLWNLVPYLALHEAHTALTRLAVADGPRARTAGVLTALITSSRPVPVVAPVLTPCDAHEAVHYVFSSRQVPDSKTALDAAVSNYRTSPALKRLCYSNRPLRQYMERLQRWRRRRVFLVEMRRGQSGCRLLARLRQHEFAWRLVFSCL